MMTVAQQITASEFAVVRSSSQGQPAAAHQPGTGDSCREGRLLDDLTAKPDICNRLTARSPDAGSQKGEPTQAGGDRRRTTPSDDRCRQTAYQPTASDGPRRLERDPGVTTVTVTFIVGSSS
jgi:hypothetical protein